MNVTEFVELWAEGDAATNSYHKQVLLLLGHRDSGKDNFMEFLARNDPAFLIKDVSSPYQPSRVPVKVYTVSSNATICDFDSFDDSAESMGLPLGIASTYLMKKIINSADELQIILSVNFSSSKREIDKHHFTAQMRKISSWIKNIDNYANSIGLIVTNVANIGEKQVVEVNEILNHVETFLEQLRKENSQNLPMLKLLDILLKKTKGTDYDRIGIIRHEWLKVRTLVNDIKFSPTNINDFNFYIQPAASPARILTSSIGNELDERIARKMNDIFQQLQKEFEKDIHNNSVEARMKLQKMDSIQNITQTSNRNVREVFIDLESKLKKLNIHLSSSFIEDIFRLDDYLQFLFSIDTNLKLSEWQKAVAKISDYITSFHLWNNFLREMDFVTSSYAVQKNCEKLFKMFIDQPITELNDERLKQFVHDYHHQSRLFTAYNDVEFQKFSSLKILSLENIFKSNLKPGLEINNSTGVTNIFGEYLILSDIVNKYPNEKYLSLNAGSKIFIDTNITRSYDERPFQMFSIISPVWELMQDLRIILDGRKGWNSFHYAGRGRYPGGTGDHAKPGYPGFSSGHFFGFGDLFIHNTHSLLISANGGNGGNGAKGGEGGEGKEGDSPVTKNCERKGEFDAYQREELSGVLFHDYCVYGRGGGDGGRGGHGAVGAEGGYAGDLTLVGFEKESNIQISHVPGTRGADGKGGVGGKAGETGESYRITKKVFWWARPQCNRESNNYCGAKNPAKKGVDGANGLDAYVRDTLQNPVKFEHPHWSSLLTTYRKYLLKDVQKLSEKKLSFLEKLNKNPSLMDLDMATTLADEFFHLDTQYRIDKNVVWVSHFEQLLYRTERYLTTKHLAEDIEIAKTVQAAILAKLVSIKNQRTRVFIIDLKSYLEAKNDIKNFDTKSRSYLIRSQVRDHESGLNSFISLADDNASIIDNNAAEVTDLIRTTQTDIMHILNESYERVEHKLAILKTFITMKDTFDFLHFVEERAKKLTESTLPANKYFFSDTEISATTTSEIKASVLQLTKVQLESWKKRFEPVLKNLVDNSTAFSSLNSQLKQNYNSLLETNNEHFYKNRKNIREFARKIVSTTELKSEEQNFIEKLGKMWFLCESQYENCHSLENHTKVANAFHVAGKGLVFSKVQQFSDNIMEIFESFFSGALEKPEDIVLGNSTLTKSLLKIQIQFQRIKQSFKLPLPELLEHSLDALEADTKRMECFYGDLPYYREMKRFQAVLNDRPSVVPLISDLDNSISLSLLQHTYQNSYLTPFYQIDFPFAYEDAKDIEVTADNYHVFKKEASTAIDSIRSKVTRGPIIDHVQIDKEVDLMYSRNELHEMYRWKGEENVKTIENLLRGKPVTIKADILKEFPYGEQAVKVRNVNFELQTKNETLQTILDKDLDSFGVTMRHFGVSYYKCRDSIFTYTHTPFSIVHSFAINDERRVDSNMVYSKLKKADYVLSPFTIWRMQLKGVRNKLESRHFQVLQKYEANIDIVLKVDYVYLRDNDLSKLPFVPNSEGDYCNSKAMRKYYKNEDILFQINSTDFDQELEVASIKTSSRFKRKVGHYETPIAPEVIDSKKLNYSSIKLPNHHIVPKIPVLNSAGSNENGGINACSGFQYNLNDCLVLLSLMAQRVTKSKQYSYFQDCAVDYSKARQCALDIVRKFEESLKTFSENYESEYTFDPVQLIAELEQDIINYGGQNVNQILLNAISPSSKPVKETFFQRLWSKLMTKA